VETKSFKTRQTADNNPAYKIYLFKEVQCLGHENELRNLCQIYIYMYIYIHTYIHTHIYSHKHTDSKPNCLKFLFPQNGYNVNIKAIHILNAPPFTDALISLVKSVFDSKLAEKVSDFNGLHFLLALTFTISTFSSTKRPFPSVRASPSNRKLLSPITYISEQLHVYYNCDLQ